jgi:hypothetical protein
LTWDDADRQRVRSRVEGLGSALPGVETTDDHGHTSLSPKGKRIGWLLVDHHVTAVWRCG